MAIQLSDAEFSAIQIDDEVVVTARRQDAERGDVFHFLKPNSILPTVTTRA